MASVAMLQDSKQLPLILTLLDLHSLSGIIHDKHKTSKKAKPEKSTIILKTNYAICTTHCTFPSFVMHPTNETGHFSRAAICFSSEQSSARTSRALLS